MESNFGHMWALMSFGVLWGTQSSIEKHCKLACKTKNNKAQWEAHRHALCWLKCVQNMDNHSRWLSCSCHVMSWGEKEWSFCRSALNTSIVIRWQFRMHSQPCIWIGRAFVNVRHPKSRNIYTINVESLLTDSIAFTQRKISECTSR